MSRTNETPRRVDEIIAADGAAGMQRLGEFTRRILAVPKSAVERKATARKPVRKRKPKAN